MTHQTQIKVALSWMDKQRSKTNMHPSSSTENPFLQSLLHEHLMSAIWIQGLISLSCLLCTNPHCASFSMWGANYRFWPSESGSWIKFAISSCVFLSLCYFLTQWVTVSVSYDSLFLCLRHNDNSLQQFRVMRSWIFTIVNFTVYLCNPQASNYFPLKTVACQYRRCLFKSASH